MIPQFYRSVGPGIAVQQNAGLAAAAEAGVGRELQQLGGEVVRYAEQQKRRSDILAASRAWRQLDTWRIEYLQGLPKRRKDLAATTIDPETGSNVTGYERELDTMPDSLNAEFSRLSEGLSADARAMLEERFNTHAPHWSAQAVDTLDHLELEDVTAEILDLGATDRVSEAMELLAAYGDRLSPADRTRIEAKLQTLGQEAQVQGAQQYLIGLARSAGWPVAKQALQDPEFPAAFSLDLKEAGEMMTQLEKFANNEEKIAEAARRAVKEANNDAVIADARQGKLDPTTLWDRVRNDDIDAAPAEQALKIATEPRSENDPAAYGQLEDMLDGFSRGAISQMDAKAKLNSLAGQLKPSTYEGARREIANTYSAQVQAKQDVVSRARGQIVDMASDDDFAAFMASITNPEVAQTAGEKRKEQLRRVSAVEDEIDQFIQRKPDASREEILRMGRIVMAELGGAPAAASPWGEVAIPPIGGELVPAGLEGLWPTLNDQEKASVRTLLGKGVSVERILQEAGQ